MILAPLTVHPVLREFMMNFLETIIETMAMQIEGETLFYLVKELLNHFEGKALKRYLYISN